MINTLKAYCARLFTSKLFIAAAVLAFTVTLLFTANGAKKLGLKTTQTDLDYSLLASLGIPGFFSIFTSLFLGTEHRDGTIRNKLISGKSRAGIYLSSLAAMAAALGVMTAAWLAGAVAGANTLPDTAAIVSCTVTIFGYNLANLALLVLISMNCTNMQLMLVIEFLLFQTGICAALFLQAMMNAVGGVFSQVLKLLLNALPFGQWLLLSPIGSHEQRVAAPIMVLISAAIISAVTALGRKLI
ncbi:MAG: hypothetical protein IJ129_05295, partial [Ruminococcus sp.]|nr:hypothetical protein [Ruminococcus sp.]